MKNRKIENYIFSVIFFVAMFAFAILSALQTVPELKKVLEDVTEENKSELVNSVDTCINENVYMRYECVEMYGTLNRLLGKKEINGFDYAVDKNGSYNSVNFWLLTELDAAQRYAQQLLMLKEEAEDEGAEFVFLAFPNKYNEKWCEGYEGIPYNGYNEMMDQLLLWNRRYGINYIDYREMLANKGLSFEEMFYRTDHHWNAMTAFYAFEELVGYMNEKFDAELDSDGYYRDIRNYNVEILEKSFLGSSGRKAGIAFGNQELEDFHKIVPKFNRSITLNGKTGGYLDTVLLEKRLEKGIIYESDMYSFYMDGVSAKEIIINNDNLDGPKILFIRDSYASPLIVDMIPLCSQIDCIWGKYATDEVVKDIVNKGNYDYVLVGYYTENLNDEFFQFYVNDYPEE
ncbi:MAG: hypothetical protein E7252_00615 [Lachnospira sp.]|nr:hypothetical protein [Lachnospira sp.]